MAIRFLATNLWDTATVTANSEATGFPVSNIATSIVYEHWRSTGLTSEWVKADLGSAQAIRAIVVRYSNLRVGDSISLQGHASDSWTSPTVNVAVTITADMVSKGVIVYNWTSDQSYQWWRIIMTATAHPDGYIRIGRIFLGTYVEPDNDYDKDYLSAPYDPSTVLTTPTNQDYVNVYPQYQKIKLNFAGITAADFAKFDALRAALGTSRKFFVELDPSGSLTTDTFYVLCTSGWEMQHVYGKQKWTMELSMKETF